jgi:hypothetical protein
LGNSEYEYSGLMAATWDLFRGDTTNWEDKFFEHHQRSPATRWYTQEQACRLYREVGFADLQTHKGFTQEPAEENDRMFTVTSKRPGMPPGQEDSPKEGQQ